MSLYSGCFDFADEIDVHGGFEEFKKMGYEVYIGDCDEPIPCNTIKDVIPYYPHIITCSVASNEKKYIFLSEKSWVDIEEEKYGHTDMHDLYRNKLKKEIEKYN